MNIGSPYLLGFAILFLVENKLHFYILIKISSQFLNIYLNF